MLEEEEEEEEEEEVVGSVLERLRGDADVDAAADDDELANETLLLADDFDSFNRFCFVALNITNHTP